MPHGKGRMFICRYCLLFSCPGRIGICPGADILFLPPLSHRKPRYSEPGHHIAVIAFFQPLDRALRNHSHGHNAKFFLNIFRGPDRIIHEKDHSQHTHHREEGRHRTGSHISAHRRIALVLRQNRFLDNGRGRGTHYFRKMHPGYSRHFVGYIHGFPRVSTRH